MKNRSHKTKKSDLFVRRKAIYFEEGCGEERGGVHGEGRRGRNHGRGMELGRFPVAAVPLAAERSRGEASRCGGSVGGEACEGVATEYDGVRARSVPAECTVRACARKKRNRNEVCEEEEKEADGLYL